MARRRKASSGLSPKLSKKLVAKKKLPPCDLEATGRVLTASKAKGLGRVRIHLNLHNGCVVVSSKGRVQGYVRGATLKNVRPRVGMAGYQKCKREQVRNVHSYLEGELASVGTRRPSGGGWRKISYNCKTHGPYFFFKKGGGKFEGAAEVRLIRTAKAVEVWAKGKPKKENPPHCACRNPGGLCGCGLVDSERPLGVNPIHALLGGEKTPVSVVGPTWPGTLNYWDVEIDSEEGTVPAWDLYTPAGKRWVEPNPGDEEMRRRERESAQGSRYEAARHAAEQRRRGIQAMHPIFHQLGMVQQRKALPDRMFMALVSEIRDEAQRLVQYSWRDEDGERAVIAHVLTDEHLMAKVLDDFYQDPMFFIEQVEDRLRGEGLAWKEMSTHRIRLAVNVIMPMARRKQLMAEAWRHAVVREEEIAIWGDPERARIQWVGIRYPGDPGQYRSNPLVRPCGSPVPAHRLGVHMIQRRPYACVVLLDLDNVDSYGPRDAVEHGLCPMIAGWGIRGGQRIARKGLGDRLDFELNRMSRHQFVPQLVALASRLGMDMLDLEDRICQEGHAWYQAKAPTRNPDWRTREIERMAAAGDQEAMARLNVLRRREQIWPIRGTLYVGERGGIAAAIELRDRINEESPGSATSLVSSSADPSAATEGGSQIPFRAPHYTSSTTAIEQELEMARKGIFLIDEAHSFRRTPLKTMQNRLMRWEDAPFVFVVTKDEKTASKLPQWIRELPRWKAEGNNPPPVPLTENEAKALRVRLGRKVAEARRLVGVSQRALAARMGKSPSWVREIESGGQYAPHYLILSLAEAAGVPLSWFYGVPGPAEIRRGLV